MVYIAQSPADMTELKNKDRGNKEPLREEGHRGYPSPQNPAYSYIIIPQSESLALKMSRHLTEKMETERETEIEIKKGEVGH